MILGIGTDMVEIARIEKLLADAGERFRERTFTVRERETAKGKFSEAAFLAKRFAAKEACAKALGIGFGERLSWQEIEITNNALGAPELTLSGKALARLNRLTPPGKSARAHVSLSDEKTLALAFVILEAD